MVTTTLQCQSCHREMHSTGSRGLCAHCLFAMTTMPLEPSTESDLGEAMRPGGVVGAGGRFLLMDRLGKGGMGEVWLANDLKMSEGGREQHLVALKFLPPDFQQNKDALEILRDEVRRALKLNHPNIVKVQELHFTQSGAPFIKMEYVDGSNLAELLPQQPGKVMQGREVQQIAVQLAGALQHAHETASTVHRDIKPGNILVTASQTIKLTDFGIAQALFARSGRTSPTASMGTVLYASPEQLNGEDPRPSDDLYAVGATLYELLTGTPPFSGKSIREIVQQVRFEPPEPLHQRLARLRRRNEIPPALQAIVEGCLSKNPLERPVAREILKTLNPASHTTGHIPAPPRPPVRPVVEWPETETAVEPPRSRVAATVTLSLLGVLLAVVALVVFKPDWIEPVFPQVAALQKRPSSATNAAAALETNAVASATPAEPAPVIVHPVPRRPAEPAPAPEPKFGQFTISIFPADRPHDYRLLDEHGKELGSGKLASNETLGNSRFPVGEYTVEIAEGWYTIPKKMRVLPDTLTTLSFDFRWHYLSIDSDPPGAWVTYPEKMCSSYPGGLETPRTALFRAGTIEFVVSKPGYKRLATNFTLSGPGQKAHFTLARSLSPQAGTPSPYTNSLGMTFVWIDRFWICTTETRVGEFRAFAQPDSHPGMISVTAEGLQALDRNWANPGFPQSLHHPVVGINWHDAKAFCAWLTEAERAKGFLETNQFYSLPSTNDWVLAAGGLRFPWGNLEQELNGSFNYSGNEVKQSGWPASWLVLKSHLDDYPRTAPVSGRDFKANRYGLYHLGGNAAEWCEEQVLCGRSWADGEEGELAYDWDYLQTTSVQRANPSERQDRYGFRVVIRHQ